jgi:hypothetical protein
VLPRACSVQDEADDSDAGFKTSRRPRVSEIGMPLLNMDKVDKAMMTSRCVARDLDGRCAAAMLTATLHASSGDVDIVAAARCCRH